MLQEKLFLPNVDLAHTYKQISSLAVKAFNSPPTLRRFKNRFEVSFILIHQELL